MSACQHLLWVLCSTHYVLCIAGCSLDCRVFCAVSVNQLLSLYGSSLTMVSALQMCMWNVFLLNCDVVCPKGSVEGQLLDSVGRAQNDLEGAVIWQLQDVEDVFHAVSQAVPHTVSSNGTCIFLQLALSSLVIECLLFSFSKEHLCSHYVSDSVLL